MHLTVNQAPYGYGGSNPSCATMYNYKSLYGNPVIFTVALGVVVYAQAVHAYRGSLLAKILRSAR